jgi:hypothetical protein
MNLRLLMLIAICAGTVGTVRAEVTVEAWRNGKPPVPMPTRTLTTLPDFKPPTVAPKLDQFGGWVNGPQSRAGTGFFRAEKIGDRWWLVTPEGHAFIHIGVATVSPDSGPTFKAAFAKRFQDRDDWARQTATLLHTNGFNGTGNWSADEALAVAPQRLVYTRGVNFMSAFAKKLGLTHVVPGHTGYQDELIPVFHPDFPKFCDEYAQQLATTKDDPWLLGIYSDNELQLPKQAIERYLQRPTDDPGRKELEAWLAARHADTKNLTAADHDEWTAHVMDRYYTLVGTAIHNADPHHIYLGSRLHGTDASNAALWKVAGKHLPVIAMNVYGDWTPTETVRKWEQWSGRPMMATEWYAKAQDAPGLANKTGAGWNVKTQRDRALFYQNFTLALLEARGCVGWHWFKYADNDPANPKADPSNLDSNKGIVNCAYQPYAELLDAMQALNAQVYPLTAFFDRR